MAKIMSDDEQLQRWAAGDSIHNGEDRSDGECCPDFSCCRPELLAPEHLRKAFVKADKTTRRQMLMMFLGGAVETDNVYIAEQGPYGDNND